MSHVIRRFRPEDRDKVIAFAASLPEHDLLFLSRDVREPRVVTAWLDAIETGEIDSLVAEDGGAIVATAALVHDPLSWSRHVGEVRLLVASGRRGSGLGSDLLQAIFMIAQQRGLAKLTARMTVDQTGSIALFEGVGFRAEAMLKDQVRGADGTSHDIAILSYDAARVAARHQAIGIE
ncbi:GNAT family N-acetyltransferase [Sphingomonas panacisoli]|uniref:GNAT family N-acetyltransferase n=1 Tax=Sphingomonas panacisoli TaxID=1813879 RepID=A0A5B8LJG9_9SPHN|nr:GNAT family N-acetyltransferase [Sphingomonas panacisoli]QDZ08368.1 GNAT family N-acetyltransferase [Sphingomonas panacisoli]